MERAFSIGTAFKREQENGPLVVEMAFASEQPYERWWGVEVLQMSGVRLARLNEGDGGPVLFNHNWDDLRGRHVPGSVRADKDGVLRGRIEIPQATQATRDAAALVESRTLTKASVGYQIHAVVEKTTKKSGEPVERPIEGRAFERLLREHRLVRDGREVGGDLQAFRRALDSVAGPLERADDAPATYLVVDWEPLENSLVTVPADNSVGVGRSLEQPAAAAAPTVSQPAAPAALQEKAKMADTTAAAGMNAEEGAQTRMPAQPRQGPSAMDLEKARVRGIENLCQGNKIDDKIRDHWIGSGLSIEAITEDLLNILEERGKTNPEPITKLGLTHDETRKFSLFRAVLAVADKNWTNAGFELECSREIAKKLGRTAVDPNRFFVPFEVQQRQVPVPMKRDVSAGTPSAGGYLVATENMSFIELLRNRSVAFRMGARRLSGMEGNVTIPRHTGTGTATWLQTETSTISEVNQTFGQLSLTPKTVGAYTEISRQLMLQSNPSIEGIVTNDLATVTGLAVDTAVLSGSGAAGQPTGITNTAGIGSVTGTSLAFDDILEFQTDVAAANVMPERGGYVTTHAVASLCIQRVKYTNTASPLWEGNVWDGQMQGFPAMASNQMASATMLFGDWAQVLVAEWGVLEIEVNPYANFQAAITGIRSIYTMDCGLRYAGAFSYASSIT